tara:strand:+ start:328 stop:1428 length:1101 start_codon:yes stop_codon:yes gene_type:complete
MANVALDGMGAGYQGTYASKILLEPMFHSDSISGNYTIYPSVKYKQNITMAPALRGITAVNEGCGPNAGCDPAGFSVTKKTITVENVSVKQEQCWTEFKDQIIVESYKNGISMPDLSGTQLADVIINRVRNGIMNDMSRNIWAGMTATAVADCTYESMGEGLWDKLGADANFAHAGSLQAIKGSGVAADYNVVSARIPSADAATVLGQAFEGAPSELQQLEAGRKRMFMTPNIYNAWYASLTAVATAGSVDYGHSEAQTGKGRLYFRGIECVPLYTWDEALTARTGADKPDIFGVLDSAGAGFDAKNGVIYASIDNLFIGTDVNAPENELKMFYDEVTDKMYIRSYFTMGFQYGWSSLVYGACLTS